MENVIFDLEVFPSWWCMVYTNPKNINDLKVITSESKNYLQWIRDLKYDRCLIGFNIKNYDLRILNAIEHGSDPYRVYETSKAIINNDESDLYNNYNYWNRYNFSDLFDDWRFGSLKEFESNIGMDIRESEVSFDKECLSREEKDEIIKYCKHDVEATVKLFHFRKEYIDSKLMLGKLFDIPERKVLKSTNAKLCALALEATPQYRTPNYNFIIPKKVEPYIRENLPQDIIDLFSVLSTETKTVNLFDNVINFGIGGIHSVCSENIIAMSDDKYSLLNFDVTSYYPNLMMKFGYMSRNISNPKKYEEIYNKRVELKKQANAEAKLNGKTPLWVELNAQQTALKLILNTTYGATKNKYNALFDEYQASSLCYLGQLLLAALCNKAFNTIPNCKIIQLVIWLN